MDSNDPAWRGYGPGSNSMYAGYTGYPSAATAAAHVAIPYSYAVAQPTPYAYSMYNPQHLQNYYYLQQQQQYYQQYVLATQQAEIEQQNLLNLVYSAQSNSSGSSAQQAPPEPPQSSISTDVSQPTTQTAQAENTNSDAQVTYKSFEDIKPKQLAALVIGLTVIGKNWDQLSDHISKITQKPVSATESKRMTVTYYAEIRKRQMNTTGVNPRSPNENSTEHLIPVMTFNGRSSNVWLGLIGSYIRSTPVQHSSIATEFQVVSRIMVKDLMRLTKTSVESLVLTLNVGADQSILLTTESLLRWLQGRMCHLPAVEVAGALACAWHEKNRKLHGVPSILEAEKTIQAWGLRLPGDFWAPQESKHIKMDQSHIGIVQLIRTALSTAKVEAMELRSQLAMTLERRGMNLTQVASAIREVHRNDVVQPRISVTALHSWFIFVDLGDAVTGLAGELLLKWLKISPDTIPKRAVKPEVIYVEDDDEEEEFERGGPEDSGAVSSDNDNSSGRKNLKRSNAANTKANLDRKRPANMKTRQQYGYLKRYGNNVERIPIRDLFGIPPKITPHTNNLVGVGESHKRIQAHLTRMKFKPSSKVPSDKVATACLALLQVSVPLEVE